MTSGTVTNADVAVVGGGPGGTAAAITAATAGVRVVLLEREIFPRLRPGETLHPGVESVLARLGIGAADLAQGRYLRHPGVWIETDAQRRFEAYGQDDAGPWLGFQIPRDDLDSRLLTRAAAAGAIIWQPCRVRDARAAGENQFEIVTDQGTVRTRWIIDGGGGRHWLARRWGIPIRSCSQRLIARYGYAEGHCPSLDGPPTFHLDRDGWTWTAHIDARRYHWTRLSLGRRSRKTSVAPPALAALRVQFPTRAENVTWRYAERCAGSGFFLVGDAAGVLDPAASKGVLRALMSGIMAGHLIAQVETGGAAASAAAQHYDHWLRGWLESDIRSLRAWYQEAQMAVAEPPADVRRPRTTAPTSARVATHPGQSPQRA